jgi:hypothetical protein
MSPIDTSFFRKPTLSAVALGALTCLAASGCSDATPKAAAPTEVKTPVTQVVTPAAPATPTYTPRWHALPAEQEMAREALRRIQTWAADGGVKNNRKLYVVYYCPSDVKPLPGYRERLDRAVKHVRDYYAREMISNGLPPITFGIETDDKGLLKMHECTGELPLAKLDKHGNAGSESRKFGAAALKAAGIDIGNNHVLIVCQVPDGISPYYGGGDQKAGVCWICDLPGFDPVNLASRLSKEETFKLAANDDERKLFRGRALGDHTTVYMGGTAHELGHCFNLPHTGDSPEQLKRWGTSLMGSGNYAYGTEERGGNGAFLNPTDALRLIAQPLFAGVDKQVETDGKAVFTELKAVKEGDGVRVTGRIKSANTPVYATIVTFNFDQPGGDYPSNSTASLVDPKSGEFTAVIKRSHTGPVDLMLTALHVNGARTIRHTATASRGYGLDTAKLNLTWAFLDAKQLYAAGHDTEALDSARRAATQNPDSAAIAATAASWERALAPKAPGAAPAARPASETSVSLADCVAVSEKTGYGPARPSHDLIPSRDHGPVADIGGSPGARSLFTHAPGSFTFNLGGGWKKLSGTYGVQRGAHGAVKLKVVGDGKTLFEGPVVDAAKNYSSGSKDKSRAQSFSADVTGVKTLELSLTGGPAGNSSAWGVILDPTLTR